ncbi:MAG: type III pantothenate kinase [Candidatus Zixiibacteriota bacterium]|nr:MAG: type III pantothenate kinase [candidate division Zixibacteria bacterium]
MKRLCANFEQIKRCSIDSLLRIGYIPVMLLAIDIGNTNTVIGAYDNGRLIDHFRVASNRDLTVDECGFFVTGLLEKMRIEPSQVDRVAMASVVPRLTPIFEKMSRKYMSVTPLIVTSDIRLPIRIAYDDPKEVGSDRIANAVAAYTAFGGPIIVVDYGTAITLDVIAEDGTYLGGVIAPGPETGGSELARKAARLFEVPIEKPERVIGRSTADSIKSGLFHGTVGQVDAIIQLIHDELGFPARVIATGGLANDFVKNSRFIESSNPILTLEGLKIIADFQLGE